MGSDNQITNRNNGQGTRQKKTKQHRYPSGRNKNGRPSFFLFLTSHPAHKPPYPLLGLAWRLLCRFNGLPFQKGGGN
jgi:hypothetical protein